MQPMDPLQENIEKAHQEAAQAGQKTYKDPVTGFEVYTRDYLVNRGFCCNQGCRHCPYSDPNISSINMNAARKNLNS